MKDIRVIECKECQFKHDDPETGLAWCAFWTIDPDDIMNVVSEDGYCNNAVPREDNV